MYSSERHPTLNVGISLSDILWCTSHLSPLIFLIWFVTDFIREHIPFLNLFTQVLKSLFAERWQDIVKSRCCEKKCVSVKYAVVKLKKGPSTVWPIAHELEKKCNFRGLSLLKLCFSCLIISCSSVVYMHNAFKPIPELKEEYSWSYCQYNP